jgi:nickel/cobalt transporter (NicO) family protein
MKAYWAILGGSLVLSVLHAAIPNHWAPLVVLGKTERWTARQLALYTAIAGFAHTVSTVLVGIIVGVIGVNLSREYQLITRILAPTVLIALGVLYLILDVRSHRGHRDDHGHGHIEAPITKTTLAIVMSLSAAMFFSPCLEIEAYYFTASRIGWTGIWTLSIVYVVVTVTGMVVLTWLGRKGLEKMSPHILEHHERAITGAVLIVLGIIGVLLQA